MMQDVSSAHKNVITIDGPAASGKSTVAQRVAERLAVPFVSSGLLYRAATHLVLEDGVEPDDASAVDAVLERHDVTLEPRVPHNRVWIDGRNVTERLHTDRVDAHVSAVAAHPDVRQWVMDELRELEGPFVVEGRDMGTNVFPGATSKFYLTASPEERARRRVAERAGALDEVASAIRRRDARDAKQLRPASDAVHIDTDGKSLDDVVDVVLAGLDEGERVPGTP